ncbi:MAG: DnaA regulatory inactivator Hda [Thiotrichales bacterium]|nr:DnaA regulatory inactivator Hda [Thiotrichales bacterium]
MSQHGAPYGQQIPLPFTQFEPLDFDLWLTGDNREVQAILEQTAAGEQTRSIYLWGEQGCGKSHLIQATCKRAAETGIAVAYLPLQLFIDKPVSILEGLGQLQLVCIDDLDNISGRDSWEQALFHLYNELNDRNAVMVMASRSSPRTAAIELADLKSRLSWGLVYQMHALADDDKRVLLKRKANTRGFNLSAEVIDYLMSHTRRDLKSLLQVLDRIDEASLSEQRKITVPFIKTLL